MARVPMPRNRGDELARATAEGRYTVEVAKRQARTIREVADQLIDAGSKLSSTGSEVLGAVLGGALGAGVGIALTLWSPIFVAVAPFLGVAGLCTGLLTVRGRSGIAQDRERRSRFLYEQEAFQSARRLRSEIRAAISDGLPEPAQQQLWGSYVQALPEPINKQVLLLPSGKEDDG